MDGLFTAAHARHQVAVKVKIFNAASAERAKHEYEMMHRLHQADGNCFVRPFALVDGPTSHCRILSHIPEDEEFCATALCIVMERGTIDLYEFCKKHPNIGRVGKLGIVEMMLDILISAARCKMVLNDFKPSNIVLANDGCYSRWKAIDFENSRGEGEEMLCEATAAYCSPEVAREILARSRGESPTPLHASQKMDTMSLALTAFEIACGKSFWNSQTPSITEDGEILHALAHLKDEHVKAHIDRTFPDPTLRSWLVHALKVNPKERASAFELLHGHSLFGSKDRTVDQDGWLNQLNKGVERILGSIDELSDQLESSLGRLGSSLDCVAAQAALGSERQMQDISALVQAVHQQKELLLQGIPLDKQALQAAVASAVSYMEESLGSRITSSLGEMISSVGASETEKLDVLLEMVSGLQSQSDRLAEEFKLFKTLSESQSSMLAILEKNGNIMPLTFVIIPRILSDKLPAAATMKDKMRNFANKKSKCVTRLLWDESVIVFFCPVTQRQVGGCEAALFAFHSNQYLQLFIISLSLVC